MRTAAGVAVAVVLLAACSPEVSIERIESNTDEPVDAAEIEAAISADEPTTTSAVPSAPEPVTASTVHETRTDDFPDILAAQATPEGDGNWRFDVTVSSPYDTPERYADAWRVVGADGTEYGIRVLTHDHASEQPFTRSQGGIAIPPDVTTVTIEGRDQANGWGGGFLTVDLAAG